MNLCADLIAQLSQCVVQSPQANNAPRAGDIRNEIDF
jgi:hypothetical protein